MSVIVGSISPSDSVGGWLGATWAMVALIPMMERSWKGETNFKRCRHEEGGGGGCKGEERVTICILEVPVGAVAGGGAIKQAPSGTGAEWVLVWGGVLGTGTGVLVYLIVCKDKTKGLGEIDRVEERQCCKGRVGCSELGGRWRWAQGS
ncbi:hypothetical protein BDN71DRAFT_1429660 [Pleurotus eryngii]|uniref:Uncharacterized protein n=1 Tax=Pleurotus eryngii TaxID=5323 RepID=A0A9P6A0D5_PLEER|nr:hypothetical protein BDN71DRAFT_1429660 [Pleurotus eryngii]